MALKKAQIANFTNRAGFTDALLSLPIRKVIFHYDEGQIEIRYELVPSNWQPGMEREYKSQFIEIDLEDMEILQIIGLASGKIWQINGDVPFLETFDLTAGTIVKKSLNELEAEIVDAL